MTNHPACPNIPLLTQITRLRFLRGHSLLSSLKLHPAQFHLLAMLHHDEGMSQAEIAGKLMVKPSTLTVMVRRMMKNGLVERKQDVLDGRVQRVYCTEKGVRLLLQAQQLFAQIEQRRWMDSRSRSGPSSRHWPPKSGTTLRVRSTGRTNHVSGSEIPGRSKLPIILVMLLLMTKVATDLFLPLFTSQIVNVGIQQGGLETALPLALTADTFEQLVSESDATTRSLLLTHTRLIPTPMPSAHMHCNGSSTHGSPEIQVLAPQHLPHRALPSKLRSRASVPSTNG
jgi:DNA-binding MarR family transcriptional regulator